MSAHSPLSFLPSFSCRARAPCTHSDNQEPREAAEVGNARAGSAREFGERFRRIKFDTFRPFRGKIEQCDAFTGKNFPGDALPACLPAGHARSEKVSASASSSALSVLSHSPTSMGGGGK